MDNYIGFDKLSTPIFICDDEWRVVFRNKASKKFTKQYRVNSSFDRAFNDGDDIKFPEKNGNLELIGCFINDTYKTALLLEYKGKALIIFSSFFEFDILFNSLELKNGDNIASFLREVLDVFADSNAPDIDRFDKIESVRKYVYSAIDNYVALSLFDTPKRVESSFAKIYRFFHQSIIKSSAKAGYKIELDLGGLADIGDNIYTDTMYFTMVLSNLMLLCLSVSNDKKCIIKSDNMGYFVRNQIKFTLNEPLMQGRRGTNIKDFMCFSPSQYLNFLPFEELGKSLGWRFGYSITADGEMNASIFFDIDHDNIATFRSTGTAKVASPEEIITAIVSKLLF